MFVDETLTYVKDWEGKRVAPSDSRVESEAWDRANLAVSVLLGCGQVAEVGSDVD